VNNKNKKGKREKFEARYIDTKHSVKEVPDEPKGAISEDLSTCCFLFENVT
jgi:hypothetical protein